MLVAALAQDPDALQRSAQGRAFHPGFLRQSIAQGAIGHAELEGADGFFRTDPAPLQVFERFGTLQQCLMVVLDDLAQQLRIVRRALERHRKFLHRGLLRRRCQVRRRGSG